MRADRQTDRQTLIAIQKVVTVICEGDTMCVERTDSDGDVQCDSAATGFQGLHDVV